MRKHLPVAYLFVFSDFLCLSNSEDKRCFSKFNEETCACFVHTIQLTIFNISLCILYFFKASPTRPTYKYVNYTHLFKTQNKITYNIYVKIIISYITVNVSHTCPNLYFDFIKCDIIIIIVFYTRHVRNIILDIVYVRNLLKILRNTKYPITFINVSKQIEIFFFFI